MKQFLLWWVPLFWFGNPIQINSMPPDHWKVCLKHWFSLHQWLKMFLSKKRIKRWYSVLRVGKCHLNSGVIIWICASGLKDTPNFSTTRYFSLNRWKQKRIFLQNLYILYLNVIMGKLKHRIVSKLKIFEDV